MSRAKLCLFVLMAVTTCYGVARVFYVQMIRLEHRGLINQIYAQRSPPESEAVSTALQDYEVALRLRPCLASLHREKLLLLAERTDTLLQSDNLEAHDEALAVIDRALGAQLACTPKDGKAWLDLAEISLQREGFTSRTEQAYRMSATVAPGESWLAKKRMVFALRVAPLLSKPTMETIARDLATLERAHPNHIHAVIKAAGMTSKPELYALFSLTPPAAAVP